MHFSIPVQSLGMTSNVIGRGLRGELGGGMIEYFTFALIRPAAIRTIKLSTVLLMAIHTAYSIA